MRDLLARGVLALVLSLIVNGLVVWTVAATGAVRQFDPLDYGPVFLLTTLGVVGATVVYALVRRWSGRPERTFGVVVVAALLVSFLPDVLFLPGDPGATTAGIAVLMAMHVTVAAVCYAVLTG